MPNFVKMIQKTEIEKLYNCKKYTIDDISRRIKISYWALYNFMRKYNIQRRGRSEAGFNFNRTKPQFEIKSGLYFAEEKLKIAGIMLYWAEGTLNGNTVDFTNSNPEMIRIFLKFLREICGVSEERLRVYLYAYSHKNINKIKQYWSKITGIDISQFTKPYVRTGNLNLSRRKLTYGMIHVRYNDKKLLELLKSWICECWNSSLIWAGTQVAKGGRLCKSSAPMKVGM